MYHLFCFKQEEPSKHRELGQPQKGHLCLKALNFPNTGSHPTKKLCESLPGHFSAHILSKRTKDDSDIVNNEIKRGHLCANIHLTPCTVLKKTLHMFRNASYWRLGGFLFVFQWLMGSCDLVHGRFYAFIGQGEKKCKCDQRIFECSELEKIHKGHWVQFMMHHPNINSQYTSPLEAGVDFEHNLYL